MIVEALWATFFCLVAVWAAFKSEVAAAAQDEHGIDRRVSWALVWAVLCGAAGWVLWPVVGQQLLTTVGGALPESSARAHVLTVLAAAMAAGSAAAAALFYAGAWLSRVRLRRLALAHG